MRNLILLFLCLSYPELHGAIIHVKSNYVGGNQDGTSWVDAISNLKYALDIAQPGDSVWVAQGTYYTNFNTDQTVYLELKDSVALFGGFAGTETHFSQRDWELYPTILDGDIGLPGDSTDNSYTLLYIGTSGETTIVDGFIFKNATANGTSSELFHPHTSGGAIYIYGKNSYAYPKIRNCRFEKNAVINYGGAVYIYGSNGSVAPQFENCVFDQNRAVLDGGAIRKEGSSWLEIPNDFYRCVFSNNYAGRVGAGIFIRENVGDDDINIVECEFINNEAVQVGGSLYLNVNTIANNEIIIDGCDFDSNRALDGSVLMLLSDFLINIDLIKIKDCEIRNNKASDTIGGVLTGRILNISAPMSDQGIFEVNNCVFEENFGGILFFESFVKSKLDITKSIFSHNKTGIIFDLSNLKLFHIDKCVISNNDPIQSSTLVVYADELDKIEFINSIIVGNQFNYGGFYFYSSSEEKHNIIDGCILGNHFDLINLNSLPKRNFYVSNSIILDDENNSNLFTLFGDSIHLKNNLITATECDSLPPNFICGPGNIFNADPLFLDTAAGDYRLHPCSPTRNAGDNVIVNQLGITTDLDGNPRIQESTVDMGPYETSAFDVLLSGTTPADCHGESTGSATIDAQSGCGPFTLTFGGASTFTDSLPFVLDGLPPGTFDITVNDSEGRSEDIQLTIGQPPELFATVTPSPVDCGDGSYGEASAIIEGGTPTQGSYNILWSDGSDLATANFPAGHHALQVTDSLGCTVIDSFVVEAIGQLAVMADSTGISCHDSMDGSVTAMPDGVAPYSWTWQNGQTTETIVGLSSGIYTTTVTDALGCTGIASVHLIAPDSLVLSIDAATVICQGTMDGFASASASGGTLPYFFHWETGQILPLLTGLGGGQYSVTLTDGNGCETAGSVEIAENTAVQLDTLIEHATGPSEMDGAIFTNNIQGGIPPYAFLWNTGDTTNFLENTPPGNYTFTITDSLGCETAFTFTVDFEVAVNEVFAGISFSAFPNPVSAGGSISMLFEEGVPSPMKVQLFDAFGRQVWPNKIQLTTGTTKMELQMPTVSGLYWLVVESGIGQRGVWKWVVQ